MRLSSGRALRGLLPHMNWPEPAKVILLEQEGENSIGGQAFWSLGGLFMIDSPEQRRLGVKDNLELARQDWFGSAQFDRPEDHWPKQWAEAYLQFAAGEMRPWLHSLGMRWFPWSAGRNGVAAMRMATAIQCRAFTSHGVRGRVSLPPSSACYAKRCTRTLSPSNAAIA